MDNSLNLVTLPNILEQVAAQLDGFNEVVRLPVSAFDNLTNEDRTVVKNDVTQRIDQPAEWYLDSRGNTRVFIANLRKIQETWQCEAQTVEGQQIQVLVEVLPSEEFNFKTPPTELEDFGALTQLRKNKKKRRRDGGEEAEVQEGGRRRNAFILFRCYWSKKLGLSRPNLSNGQISVNVAGWWRSMTKPEQEPWYEQARKENNNGSANAGPSTAGPSTAGPSTAGSSTAGSSTAGSSGGATPNEGEVENPRAPKRRRAPRATANGRRNQSSSGQAQANENSADLQPAEQAVAQQLPLLIDPQQLVPPAEQNHIPRIDNGLAPQAENPLAPFVPLGLANLVPNNNVAEQELAPPDDPLAFQEVEDYIHNRVGMAEFLAMDEEQSPQADAEPAVSEEAPQELAEVPVTPAPVEVEQLVAEAVGEVEEPALAQGSQEAAAEGAVVPQLEEDPEWGLYQYWLDPMLGEAADLADQQVFGFDFNVNFDMPANGGN